MALYNAQQFLNLMNDASAQSEKERAIQVPFTISLLQKILLLLKCSVTLAHLNLMSPTGIKESITICQSCMAPKTQTQYMTDMKTGSTY